MTQPDEEANDDDHEEDDGDHDHDHDNGNDDQPRLDNASTSRRLPALTSSLHPQLLKELTCQDFSKNIQFFCQFFSSNIAHVVWQWSSLCNTQAMSCFLALHRFHPF